jgi:MFS family permease
MGPGGEGRAPGLWAPQRRALTTGLVLTITFVASEALAVVTVMPVVARDLGGLRLYGWVFSGFMLGSVVGIVAAGREADRRGPAVPFVAGVVLFGSGLAGSCRASAPARCPRWPTSPSAGACPMRCAHG